MMRETNQEDDSAREVQRIRQVYTRRGSTHRIRLRDDIARPGNRMMVEEARSRLADLLHQHMSRPVREYRILDVGCGHGSLLAWFHHKHEVPAQCLVGIDLLTSRIAEANASLPELRFFAADAGHLDFPKSSFDLVAAFTVFSSILDCRMAANLAREIDRVLVPGGAVMWYDMRCPNPWNPDLQAMNRNRVRSLFPGFTLHCRSVTLLPPLARSLGRLAPRAYPLLAAMPCLRTHLLGLAVKPRLRPS